MTDAARRLACVVLAALATPATAATVDKADVCHWDANRARVSSVATSSVESHFAQHGDSYPSQYFRDSDGDGFGDPAELTDRCPNVGYVTDNTDCNDADASLSPDATEVVGDGIDNDCSPLTLDDQTCQDSANSSDFEVNFSDLGENLCNVVPSSQYPDGLALHSAFSNPSIATGGTIWVEYMSRVDAIVAENPESPNADQYDLSITWEWISEAGEHVVVGPYAVGASWEAALAAGYTVGGPGQACSADAAPLPSGNWTLWGTLVDHERDLTLTTCNAAILTVP